MKHYNGFKRFAGAAAAIVIAGALGGCANDVLEVENPNEIGDDFLDQVTSVAALTATPWSDFNRYYTDLAYSGAILSDEAITGHNFFQWQEFDLRIVNESNTVLADIYEPIQIARGTAERVAERLRPLLTSPDTDLRLAQVLIFSGYDHLLLGENFCSAPVTADGADKTSDELFQLAIDRFNQAIAIASAPVTVDSANFTKKEILRIARLGAARASLNLGQKPQAATFAAAADADSVWQIVINHSDANTYQYNTYHGATTGALHNIGVGTPFRAMNDPRIRFLAPRTGHNQRTMLSTPRPSPSFEGFAPTGNTAFTRNTDTRWASSLEARYILAEAQGLTPANVTFLNTRRAVGGRTALDAATLTEATYQAALRDERSRDFYLDGHRLGDLRRYKKLYNVDLFPTGMHEDAVYGQYGTAECYIPHTDERIGKAP